jgi:hypothetical protein
MYKQENQAELTKAGNAYTESNWNMTQTMHEKSPHNFIPTYNYLYRTVIKLPNKT